MESDVTHVSRGLIVGGGIAGLASAIALQQIGVDCDLVEIGELRPVGAGIGIGGRGPNALDELGVYEEVAATGQLGLTAPIMYDAAGEVVAAPPPPPEIPGALEAVGAYRPTLAAILEKRALELGADIQTGMSIESIEDGTDAAAVTLTNGERRDYDLVVGADGIGSRTRSIVFPDAPQPQYAGQMSIRWLIPSGPIDGEGWYLAGEMGRMAFYHQPHPNLIYAPMVINMPRDRLSQQGAYEVVSRLMDNYTAPAMVRLREFLTPQSELIVRPFDWLLLEGPWHRGRTLLIGDAAHATTAHMGMGGVMALEDAVVLAKCVAEADTLPEALATFMTRRTERVRTVVETSVALSKREQANIAPGPETAGLMGGAIAALARPY
jgi:2-polyprenyl-6-methoxyphenol hydroxylase-like FAD-dependent oxidoreductase